MSKIVRVKALVRKGLPNYSHFEAEAEMIADDEESLDIESTVKGIIDEIKLGMVVKTTAPTTPAPVVPEPKKVETPVKEEKPKTKIVRKKPKSEKSKTPKEPEVKPAVVVSEDVDDALEI